MPASRSRSRVSFIIVAAVAVALVLGGAGVAYMFSGSAPAAVSLAGAGSAASADATAPTPSSGSSAHAASPSVEASAFETGAAGSVPPASSGSSASARLLDGTWKVDPSVGSFADFTDSFVGYRVAENLANVGSTTAVGRTPSVSGSLTLQGTTVTAAQFTADLTALQSDKPMRDGMLHRQALETDQYPTATFELTTPIQLPATPTDGSSWTVAASGKLTLHGVTRDVSVPLQAKLSAGVVTVVASVEIKFADYSIAPPQSMMVLSVADHGTLELQLLLRHA